MENAFSTPTPTPEPLLLRASLPAARTFVRLFADRPNREMDFFQIAGMLLRRDPKLTRDDIIFFFCMASFLFVVVVMAVVTYWTGDMPSFLRLIFPK
jgi:hypothetical protein